VFPVGRILAVALASAWAIGFAPGDRIAAHEARSAPARWHVLRDPINPDQLLDMPFGTDSPWLQPWSSTLTTRPAAALLGAIGINFNVAPSEAMATARLLHASGFRRARIEFPWGALSYADPTQVADPAAYALILTALRRYDLRPLILLNANSGGPGPATTGTVTLAAPATAGARTVTLVRDGGVAQVQPGLTGFDTTDGYMQNPGDLITSLSADGVATLSRPLPMSLPAGPVTVTTLRYAPFQSPQLADGQPNPAFEQTLSGWLGYVRTVVDFVRRTYGSSNFDVEVWNELGFGSAFLDEQRYYDPVPDPGGHGSVTAVILARTAALLHDPANGWTGVRVGDGFASQDPWDSGATIPAGVDAIDKHPYADSKELPAGQERGIDPVNALGRSNGKLLANTAAGAVWRFGFIPHYRVFMPEYYLTGVQTETLMRDLSPLTTSIYGTPHGARVHQPGRPAPRLWITEDNMDQSQAILNGMPAADIPEMQAKAALRFFVSYASEGAAAIDLYGAQGAPCCQIIPQAFFDAVDAHAASVPLSLGGPTMASVARLTAAFTEARGPTGRGRQLALRSIAQLGDAAQFRGDGTAARPSLFNREVLAFFPFQLSARRFVCAVYVMTTDITHRYTTSPSPGWTPFDLPAEQFRLTIGGVDGARAQVSLSDPLRGVKVPAEIVARGTHTIVVQLPATDSPRLLTITD
jgi:hypothetical protein